MCWRDGRRCGAKAPRRLSGGEGMRGRVTAETARAFAAEYGAGQSGPTIAAAHGVSVSTVYRWLRKAGVRRRRGRSHVRTETLAAGYEAGATLAELGAAYHMWPSSVGRRLRLSGLQMRPSGRPAGTARS
jgi:transposase-like protein